MKRTIQIAVVLFALLPGIAKAQWTFDFLIIKVFFIFICGTGTADSAGCLHTYAAGGNAAASFRAIADWW